MSDEQKQATENAEGVAERLEQGSAPAPAQPDPAEVAEGAAKGAAQGASESAENKASGTESRQESK